MSAITTSYYDLRSSKHRIIAVQRSKLRVKIELLFLLDAWFCSLRGVSRRDYGVGKVAKGFREFWKELCVSFHQDSGGLQVDSYCSLSVCQSIVS
ncbi:hypothetical protein R1flu_017791 [Riccia fluitans]|uniref:Uncharacterized protein n=1 Tax=Riccia fluitans TaxID=41844 RepID=A0ABD1ZE22_9MARC